MEKNQIINATKKFLNYQANGEIMVVGSGNGKLIKREVYLAKFGLQPELSKIPQNPNEISHNKRLYFGKGRRFVEFDIAESHKSHRQNELLHTLELKHYSSVQSSARVWLNYSLGGIYLDIWKQVKFGAPTISVMGVISEIINIEVNPKADFKLIISRIRLLRNIRPLPVDNSSLIRLVSKTQKEGRVELWRQEWISSVSPDAAYDFAGMTLNLPDASLNIKFHFICSSFQKSSFIGCQNLDQVKNRLKEINKKTHESN